MEDTAHHGGTAPDRAVIGAADELRRAGRLTGKLGSLPVLVVWNDGDAFAIEDRCPHLGFPLHRGTVESGMITCHWHHARFDLASGCTLDPWADDAAAFDVELDGDDVVVRARPAEPSQQRWSRRLREGLEQRLTLVIAKSVHALSELPDGSRIALEVAYEHGTRNRGPGWGSGLTVLTCMANLLPHLDPADRPLALIHALRFLADDTAGNPPRFALSPLAAADQPAERLLGWYRRMIETRNASGAERALATAVAAGDLDAVERAMFAAVTDHVFVDEGHTLDFTNKAFEAVAHLGVQHADLLGTLVDQTAAAERSEELSEWNHPLDLASLARRTEAELAEVLPFAGPTGAGLDVAGLAAEVLVDDPGHVTAALVEAARTGASAEQLARAVAYAAALRLVRFHLNNDPGDWNTVHHTFTTANAVHQAVVRRPSPELSRAIVHGALRVYLDRFLNVPAARVPDAVTGSMAGLGEVWDVQGGVERAAQEVWGFLRAGGSRAVAIAALGHALLQEDAGFHWYQMVEAATRQALAWPEGSEESALVLVGAARFLAAHTPTRRELALVSRTAVRLRRGEELFAE